MTFRAILVLVLAAPVFAQPCDGLKSLNLSETTIDSATAYASGAFEPAKDLPAFCRVTATVKPTADSDIKIEVWMPEAGWNGKLEGNGNGGWTGSINPATLAVGLRRKYATAMTDTGHEGGSGSFALGHPEKLIDFGYRSTHEMTVKAKAIIAAYYGRPPDLAYFNGCSAGGKQGLTEAQLFPGDYNGIISGAPGNNWTHMMAQIVWVAQAVHKDEASYIPPEKYPAIHEAALAACDARDGVKDGVIDDPTRCKFDPKAIQCKGADGPSCLTAPQVEAARKIYSAVKNPRTKQEIYPGFEPGSEMGWGQFVAGPTPTAFATDLFKFVVFKNPDWDYKTLNFDTDIALADMIDNGTNNATDPNLKTYFERGAKLLQYHGWNDQLIAPLNSVEYYQSVERTLGGAAKNGVVDKSGAEHVRASYRLFMEPGMSHCQGGDGPSNFDMLSALEQWVEQGKAPDRIVAYHIKDGKTDRSRPLCPYPQVAVYNGKGSTDDDENFTCKVR
ncbi:MAG TPA: tannase/feruloyl esterase family alpha/beta hydrolase [Bryobacteraceae bacterium]|jgi:feruloyl esterase